MTARSLVVSLLQLVVALLVLVAGVASGTGVAEAQSGVAAINPESAAAVGADSRVAPGHVGSETGLFDDGVSGCCVAPQPTSSVLLDSNVTTGLKADPSLGGRVRPGEQPVLSHVSMPEMRNAVATPGGLRGVPGAAYDLPTLSTVPDLNLRINIGGQLPDRPGRFGDGIIGGQSLESGFPLVTNDRDLAQVVAEMGGVVR